MHLEEGNASSYRHEKPQGDKDNWRGDKDQTKDQTDNHSNRKNVEEPSHSIRSKMLAAFCFYSVKESP